MVNLHHFANMSQVDDIAEMICMANGERYTNIDPHKQSTIKVYAQSIINYLKVPDSKSPKGFNN